MKRALSLLAVLLLFAAPLQAKSSDPLARLSNMQKASLLFEENGQRVISKKADQPMIPASTMKLITGLAALEHWGESHRFETDFYLDHKTLWVKGNGDPFLVSEELDLIVIELKRRGLESVSEIITDATLFDDQLAIDGRSYSDNPYDAPLSALAANFNTITYKRTSKGIVSGEPQTPMTPLAKTFAKKYVSKKRKGRVNLAKQANGPRYFAELLASKLRAVGVNVEDSIKSGKVKSGMRPLYTHKNTRDLAVVVKAMMENSSNFIANSLFLLMAGDEGPLNMQMAKQSINHWIRKRFGWKDYQVIEGSGLSRGNRLSAEQLMEVVKAFEPYRELLPLHKGKVMAKTGTLKGISCYAGFVHRKGEWEPFSLLINQPSDYNFRKRVAEALSDRDELPSLCSGKGC